MKLRVPNKMKLIATLQIRLKRPRVREARPSFVRELAQTMDVYGLLHPIVVRPHRHNPGNYWLVCGWHRLEAAKFLGWQKIDAIIIPVTDRRAQILEIEDNLCAAPLSPVERMIATERFAEAESQEDVG